MIPIWGNNDKLSQTMSGFCRYPNKPTHVMGTRTFSYHVLLSERKGPRAPWHFQRLAKSAISASTFCIGARNGPLYRLVKSACFWGYTDGPYSHQLTGATFLSDYDDIFTKCRLVVQPLVNQSMASRLYMDQWEQTLFSKSIRTVAMLCDRNNRNVISV